MNAFAKSDLMNDYHLLSYEVLDSTNEEAKRLAAGGASQGAVIWAKRQTQGRGRMGRSWQSEEGNLYVSLLLNATADMQKTAQLSFVTAVAMYETIQPILPEAAITCKWPNDLMVGDKKLGGVLIEYFTTEEGKHWVAVGIGINVEHSPKKGVSVPATSLKEEGVEIVSAKIVLSRLVYNLICQYDLWTKRGFFPIKRAWGSHAYRMGEEVEVKVGAEVKSGVFKGIDDSGRLELQIKRGKKEYITAGDVVFR